MAKMNMKIIRYIFALVLFIGIISTVKASALAASLTIKGVDQGDGTINKSSAADGWSYNASTNTLTLKGFSFINNEDIPAITAENFANFNIVLVGTDNRIDVNNDYGIYAKIGDNGTFKISGTGSLKVDATLAGIKCDSNYSSGIMRIEQCTINASASGNVATAIDSEVDLTICQSAKIDATGVDDNDGEAYGLFAKNTLTVDNASVTASGTYYGMSGYYLTIQNGAVVRATGDESGILGTEDVSIGKNAIVDAYGKYGITTNITINISSDVRSVVLTGTDLAVSGGVKNAVVGTGWSGEDMEIIEIHESSEGLGSYEKLQFPKVPPTITVLPSPNNLTYNGSEQPLITAGNATNGTMQYALGTNQDDAPAADSFGTEIPKATNAGTYYVWYRAVGSGVYGVSIPECIMVIIKEPEPENGDGSASGTPAPEGSQLTDENGENTGFIVTVSIAGRAEVEYAGKTGDLAKSKGTLTIPKVVKDRYGNEYKVTSIGKTLSREQRLKSFQFLRLLRSLARIVSIRAILSL